MDRNPGPRGEGGARRELIRSAREALAPAATTHRRLIRSQPVSGLRAAGMKQQRIFKVIFHSRGQVVELYARGVAQGALFGFVEVEELIFGVRSGVVVDPGEESLKTEFGGAKRLYLPLHAIVRIEEVEREGVARMTPEKPGEGAVHPFPLPVVPPGSSRRP